jgi:hypothetical protein
MPRSPALSFIFRLLGFLWIGREVKMPNIKKQCDTKFYKGPHSVTTYNKLKFEIFGLLPLKCITDIHYP